MAVKLENSGKPKTQFAVKKWSSIICLDFFCVYVYS